MTPTTSVRAPRGEPLAWGVLAVILAAAVAGVAGSSDGVAPGQFLLACGAAGAVGLVAIATRTSPAWLLSLGVVFAAMGGHWEYVGVPGALAPDRLLLLAGVVATVARVPSVRDRPEVQVRPSCVVFLVFSAYALGSAVMVGTLFGDPVGQLDRIGLAAFGCLLVAPVAFAEPRDRQILLWSLVGLGGYLAVTAVLETVARGLVFPTFITDPGITRHFGRARGPFLEAEANGYAMFVALTAACILRGTVISARARQLTIAVVVLCALGIVLTLTRAAWLGACLGGLAVLAATPGLRRFIVPSILATALLAAAALMFIPGFAASAGDRASNQETVWDRQNLNRAAVNMVLDAPLVGHGWNRFTAAANEYFWQADEYPLNIVRAQTGVHNLLLAKASELGLIGATLWVAGLTLAILEGLRGPAPPSLQPWRAGLVGLAVFYLVLVLVTPAIHPFELLVLLLWAGVAAGLPRARAGDLTADRAGIAQGLPGSLR